MNIGEIQEAAQRKLDEDRNARIAVVTEYAEAAKQVADLRSQLKDAERTHLAAYRAAVRLGWSETDLKAFGIDTPTLGVGGRPRKARGAAARTTDSAADEHS